MSDIKLTARTALGGYARQFDGISIAEVANRAIVSIACPRDGEKALADAVKKSLGCDMPPVGRSVVAKSGIRIAGMQPGQWFALFDFAGDDGRHRHRASHRPRPHRHPLRHRPRVGARCGLRPGWRRRWPRPPP